MSNLKIFGTCVLSRRTYLMFNCLKRLKRKGEPRIRNPETENYFVMCWMKGADDSSNFLIKKCATKIRNFCLLRLSPEYYQCILSLPLRVEKSISRLLLYPYRILKGWILLLICKKSLHLWSFHYYFIPTYLAKSDEFVAKFSLSWPVCTSPSIGVIDKK